MRKTGGKQSQSKPPSKGITLPRRVTANGWDPAFRPDDPRTAAEIVNLGYVLNVIEDPQERARALTDAWDLAMRMATPCSVKA